MCEDLGFHLGWRWSLGEPPAGAPRGDVSVRIFCIARHTDTGSAWLTYFDRTLDHTAAVNPINPINLLVTFRQQLAAEFATRNCAYTAAVPATEFYIVPIVV